MQDTAEMEKFKIFGDETVGRMFLPDGVSYNDVRAFHISPLHGRAVALKLPDSEWISVKGGGWNYGGPQVYLSRKDDELALGLYPLSAAKRELAVSREIEKFSDDFPKVLYYRKLSDRDLPEKYAGLRNARFANGEPIEPCLLYTKLECPCRVADLMYFSDDGKAVAVNQCCARWGISPSGYTDKFIEVLAARVALLHKNGFINDTLEYSNVTMLAEIVDYEWVTAPGIKLPDGTYGDRIRDERKEKELLYGAEVCLQLKALLHEKYDLFDIYAAFVASYGRVEPRFASENDGVQRILKKEDIIL